MVDPVSAGSAAAARIAGGVLLARVRDWWKGEEFDRLLEQVAERLGPGLSPIALAPLREDETVVGLIAAFFDDAQAWDEQGLVAAIEPHVGPLVDEGSPRETAEEIARIIRDRAWAAFKDPTEAVVHTVRSTRLAGPQSVVTLRLDWVPRQALARVEQLGENNPSEAHQLQLELADEARRARTVEALIRKPKPWVKQGSGALWTALGDLATAYGRFAAAERAFLAASEAPGSDRVRMLTRAAQVAHARGEVVRADRLLEQARELDSDHPSVAVVDALLISDPAAQLERLRDVEPLDDLQASGIEGIRAQAHLVLGDIDKAKRARDRAAARFPTPNVAELTSAIVYVENARRTSDEPIDVASLIEAARSYLELREEAEALGRAEEAARLGARASEIYSMTGDFRRAASLVDELVAELETSLDLVADVTRRHVANAAIEAHRPEHVALLLDGLTTDADRLMLVQSRAVVDRDPERAVPALEALLESTEEVVRWQAGRMLLAGALSNGFDWNDRAEEAVREADAVLADVMRASYLHGRGETEEAERLLHARASDSRALELLADLAVDREDWEAALQLHRRLTERGNTPERRYVRARLIESSGDIDAALGELSALSADATAPIDVRARSFLRSAQLLYECGDFSAFLEAAEAWLRFDPADKQPAWLVVRGFARLGRWEDGLRALDQPAGGDGVDSTPLEPLNEEDAELAAIVIFHALPPENAILRIASISDRFERSIERLEGLLIIAGLPSHDLPAELAERVRKSMEEFEQRFPGSQAMRTVEAPTDAEGLTNFVREHLAAGAAEAEEMFKAVYRGEVTMTLLAAFLHKHVAEVWSGSGFLPIGYGDPTLDDLENADAQVSILRPAVWDASALYVVGGLGEAVTEAALNALPGSVLPQSTLEDVVAWGDGPTADPEGEQTILGWNASTQSPRLTIIPADETARQRASARGIRELGQRLLPVPNADTAHPGRLDELLDVDKAGDAQPAFMSWPATFAVAARKGFAIFSDDRYIRLEARRAEIPTFGTVALLQGLVERGMLDRSILVESLRRLRASGAVGLIPTEADLVAELAAADWGTTELITRALHDPTRWTEVISGLRSVITLLRAVYRSAPDHFSTWVDRALEAARVSRPETASSRLTGALLSLSWITDDERFARAMTATTLEMRRRRGYLDDPVLFAAQLLANTFARSPEPVRLMVTRAVLRATPYQRHPDLIALLTFAGAPQQ